MTTDLILGTAGHIDHGKTSLIRALTGVDTDRLPEEKRRGITIELGFAELEIGDLRLGIVDVPGHERFVRQMLAGATSMDVALLVVAADDSVKQQTREHFEILRLLDLPAGVIALTKCDLADPDWMELVEEEIRDLVAESFLAAAPIIRTSATTGVGLDDLRSALQQAAEVASAARESKSQAPFRMAIDRVFTIAGHGTVVTGSVATGRTVVGDMLNLEPGGREVRVRGIQHHERPAEEIHRGQRAAINLAGVHHNEVLRGQELSSPGHLLASRLLTANISLLASMHRPLKDRTRVRVHIGTAETMASVRLLAIDQLPPGESAVAQLYLSEPIVATWSQPLVLRSESPILTIGGGTVLDPTADRIRQADETILECLERLTADDPVQRAEAALFFAGLRGWDAKDLARTAGIDDVAAVVESLSDGGALQKLSVGRGGATLQVHRKALEHTFDYVAKVLAKLHEQNPLRSNHPVTTVAHRLSWLGDASLMQAILEKMKAAGRVKLTEKSVSLTGHGPQLSRGEQQLYDDILMKYQTAAFQPPSVADVAKAATKHRDAVPQLVALAVANGELVEFAQNFYLHADHAADLRKRLADEIAARGGLTVSEIREVLDTTRKYAVPLCEYLDKIGFTRREGDTRVIADEAA